MTSFYPLAHFRLCRHRRTLGVVVDGGAEVLHVVDELVPPCRVLADGGHLLGGGDGILHRPEPVKVLALLLRHFQLESGHFLVLCLCHRFGGGFQPFAGHLQGRAYPRRGGDADGDAHDAEQLHHVHTAPSEHHHPALVRADTECEAQPDHPCHPDRIAQHRHVGKCFHGDQQLVKALVDGRQSYSQ